MLHIATAPSKSYEPRGLFSSTTCVSVADGQTSEDQSPVQRASFLKFLLCDRPREPRCLFMVQQTHNRKEIRQSEKHRRSFLHSSTPLCLPICPHKALPKASSLPFYEWGRSSDGWVGGRAETCALLHQNGRQRLLKRTCR